MRSRKYSILATDGSVKNFVSETSDEFKKSSKNTSGMTVREKKDRRSSECPPTTMHRHRRVSIIHGDSLRHFIFEEPEPTSRNSSGKRKVSIGTKENTLKHFALDEKLLNRKSSLVPGDTLKNLIGDEPHGGRKSSIAPDEITRKFSMNTLGMYLLSLLLCFCSCR